MTPPSQSGRAELVILKARGTFLYALSVMLLSRVPGTPHEL